MIVILRLKMVSPKQIKTLLTLKNTLSLILLSTGMNSGSLAYEGHKMVQCEL